MRILMIAPPGAGKGTQSTLIAAHFCIPHISSGDLMREHVRRGTELGRSVRDYLDRGELVADNVVVEMVRRALIDVKAKDESGGHEVIRSMIDPAGGRRSVDLTGLGSAFGQDQDS
jgi:adenylate kinase